MRNRLQRFLLILLMLGLPVQTFAAASMLVCASTHTDAPAQLMAIDEAMAGCHDSEPSLPQSHECKHCSLCALASVLPIPAADSARWATEALYYASPAAAAFSGFIPDGPERPPRTPLA